MSEPPISRRRRRWSFFMPALEHPPILWFDDLHRGRFTVAGRVLAWGSLATGTLLIGELTRLQLMAFTFGVALLTVAWMVGWLYRPRLRLTRRLAAYPSAGEVYEYHVRVENLGRTAVRNLVIEERGLPPELRPVGEGTSIVELQPGQSVDVRLRLNCQRRGAYLLGKLQGACSLPLGLVKSGKVHRQADRLLVCPRTATVAALELPAVQNHQPGGIPIVSSVGESTEFCGTRDWRQGDRVRDIHWPSSARAGRLIAREYQQEYFVRLALVLDIEVRRARDEPLLERAISLTAGIAEALARKDYIVDIFAAGATVHHLQTGRALGKLENILEILACVEGGDRLNVEALETALIPEAERLSAVVFVMLDWEPSRAGVVLKLRRLGVSVRVLCVRPGRRPEDLTPDEIVEGAAAP